MAKFWVVCATMLLQFSISHAQQTIFNVPSQDVLDARQVYLELDIAERFAEPHFTAITPRVVVGLGSHLEGGINLPGYTTPSVPAYAIVPTLKQAFWIREDAGLKISYGVHGYIPLSSGLLAGIFGYALLGEKFSFGPRLTAGMYGASASFTGNNTRFGVLGGLEIPVTDWLTIEGDAFSGKNALGYVTPGAAVIPFVNAVIYVAYQFSNTTSEANSFLIELGYTFP